MNDTSVRINVKVKPRGSRDVVEGFTDNILVVRLTSPPVDGAANSSLIKILSKKTGVPKSRIRIVSGEKGRSKVIQFDGIEPDDLKGRLK